MIMCYTEQVHLPEAQKYTYAEETETRYGKRLALSVYLATSVWSSNLYRKSALKTFVFKRYSNHPYWSSLIIRKCNTAVGVGQKEREELPSFLCLHGTV